MGRARLNLIALLAVSMATPLLAHGPDHLTAPRSKAGGVKADGDIGAWQDSRFVSVPHGQAMFGQPASDDDVSCRFALLWDQMFLYVAVEVRDNSIVSAPSLARLYEGDCVEVCLDVQNDSEGGYDAGDYQSSWPPPAPSASPGPTSTATPSCRSMTGPSCGSARTSRPRAT
ncbi:hypothetical protein HQ560_16735 [bacterium]|nr:hypothetical protein [bacterium]